MDMTTKSFIVCEEQDLVDVADAIRSKSGVSDPLTLGGMIEAVEAIEVPGPEWIGDGNTHIWISLPEGRTSPTLTFRAEGNVNVDWGDGTSDSVVCEDNTAVTNLLHEYNLAGDYVITVSTDGSIRFSSSPSLTNPGILWHSGGNGTLNRAYKNAIRKVEFGDKVFGIYYVCQYSYGIQSVKFPSELYLTNLNNTTNAFQGCVGLREVILPNNISSIDDFAFSSCAVLRECNIPYNVRSIGRGAFQNCYLLKELHIPGGVTSIGDMAFSGCWSVSYFDFSKHTSVPTLSATDAFQNLSAGFEIRVPAALVDEWKAATNWSTYADKIVGV